MLSYLKYLFSSSYYRGHGVHSPFIYKFVREVLFAQDHKNNYTSINQLRKTLLKNKQILQFYDFVSGSNVNHYKSMTIAEIAANLEIRHKYGSLLARAVDYYQANSILELGTGLGISTAYICKNMSNSTVFKTIESNTSFSKIAQQNISNINNKQVHFINDNIDRALPKLLDTVKLGLDFVFFDLNYTYESTISYFEQCLSKINNSTIFVFDNIHCSDEMEKSWSYIINHNKTKVCIDLFKLGFVFFRKELTKQNYIIRFL